MDTQSGFSNESRGGNGMFASFKDGKITTKVEGEKKTFTTLTGLIVDVDIEDAKFQDREYRKVTLFMKHKEGVTRLGFPLTSGYGWSFFQLCGNIDVKLPVSISGGTTDLPNSGTPPKKYGKMFIEQAGKSLKHFMKKDSEAAKKIPLVTETKVGKQVVKNYEKRDEFMEKVITAFYKKVQKMYPDGAKDIKKINSPADEIIEPIDDLPF